MILVTLGTQDKSFRRLLLAIQKLIDEKKIKERVVVQAGNTKFSSDDMELFDLISPDDFNDLISECDVLITHGGVGSIITGLKNDKKIIGVARLKEFKEHTNNHQTQILENFDKEGYIIYLKDLNNLENALTEVKKLKPKKYKSNVQNMITMLENYIDKL